MSQSHSPRVLAIAPGTRFLGVAAFEGEELLWASVKTFKGKKAMETLLASFEQYLDELFDVWRPSILAVEEVFYAQARLSPLLRGMVKTAKCWARQKGLSVAKFLPTTVKERLCPYRQTRRALAEAMVERYWFLYRYLARKNQVYWQQMFDAVGLGVLAVADVLGRRRAPSRATTRASVSSPAHIPNFLHVR